jgi:hypothetical protein
MSDDQTPRLALPLLAAGQAQKEMTHNEALARLDIAVQARVLSAGVDDPPASPTPGDCWIVGETPSGAWLGMARYLAAWTGDGWRFVAPAGGMRVWIEDAAVEARYLGSAWAVGVLSGHQVAIDGTQVVGAQAPAIADPVGGTQVDAQARSTIGEILGMLRSHGLIAP